MAVSQCDALADTATRDDRLMQAWCRSAIVSLVVLLGLVATTRAGINTCVQQCVAPSVFLFRLPRVCDISSEE